MTASRGLENYSTALSRYVAVIDDSETAIISSCFNSYSDIHVHLTTFPEMSTTFHRMLKNYALLSMRRYLTPPSYPILFPFLFLIIVGVPEEKKQGRVRSLPTLTSLQMNAARTVPNSPAQPMEPLKVVNAKPAVLLRILIVEDSLPIMKVVCQMLKQKGELNSAFLTSSCSPQSERVIMCWQTTPTSC